MPDATMPPSLWWPLRPWQRHSLVLTVAGFVYVSIGLVWLVTPVTTDRAAGLRLALRIAPMGVWALAWITVGVLSLISARWPPASKTWGYSALSGLSALWGAMYGLGCLLLHTPHAGISGAFVWFLVAFMWWAISGLANPDDFPSVI